MGFENLIKKLRDSAIDEPVAGDLEELWNYSRNPEARDVFRRFLWSREPSNREYALRGLDSVQGEPLEPGLEADALLLHFQGIQQRAGYAGAARDFAGAGMLERMAATGNETARRIFSVLGSNPEWRSAYGTPNSKEWEEARAKR